MWVGWRVRPGSGTRISPGHSASPAEVVNGAERNAWIQTLTSSPSAGRQSVPARAVTRLFLIQCCFYTPSYRPRPIAQPRATWRGISPPAQDPREIAMNMPSSVTEDPWAQHVAHHAYLVPASQLVRHRCLDSWFDDSGPAVLGSWFRGLCLLQLLDHVNLPDQW